MVPAYIAIDLGAGSGRVILGAFTEDGFSFVITERFPNGFRTVNGRDRWDFESLWNGILIGIKKAVKIAGEKGFQIKSIGCDTWGVDYGLIGEDGELSEDPVSYRDSRTVGVPDQVFRRIDQKTVYNITGIQTMPFNTIFQLFSHVHSHSWSNSKISFLMMADIVHYRLSGVMAHEYTLASTTQLINATTREWEHTLFDSLGLPHSIMAEIRQPGMQLGTVAPEICERTGLCDSVKVILPPSHDTASAVVGTPLKKGWAYLSSGTWSLLGLELDKPCLTAKAFKNNFTNEGGAYGTIRFLKNVTGLWILESCRREWQSEKILLPYDDLMARMEALGTVEGCIDPDDPSFTNPSSMRGAIADFLVKKGQRPITEQAALCRLIIQSLAAKYAEVVKIISEITGSRVEGINIVGGGSQNRLLNQLTANKTALPVHAGPVEATAIGNLAVQAITDGLFSGVGEARDYIGRWFKPNVYYPSS